MFVRIGLILGMFLLASGLHASESDGGPECRAIASDSDPALVERLLSSDAVVAGNARKVLRELPPADASRLASPLIRALVGAEDSLPEAKALMALGPAVVPQLKEILGRRDAAFIEWEKSHDVAEDQYLWEVARFAGQLGDRSVIEELLELLKANSHGTRDAAAKALGRLRATEAVPQLVEGLCSSHLFEETWIDETTALDALARIGDRSAVSALYECVPTRHIEELWMTPSLDDWYVQRRSALLSLGFLETQLDRRTVARFEPDFAIAILKRHCLSDFDSKSECRKLVALHTTDVRETIAAANALAAQRRRCRNKTSCWRKALHARNDSVHQLAAYELGRSSPGGIDALIAVIDRDPSVARSGAVEVALEWALASPEHWPALRRLSKRLRGTVDAMNMREEWELKLSYELLLFRMAELPESTTP